MENLKRKNKALALLMTVLMMLSIFSVLGTSTAGAVDAGTQTLYLKPNANWISKDARFAVYLSGGSSSAAWVSMTDAGDGYYKATVSDAYTSVIFARMNPANTTNSWANTWNKSATQTIPTNSNNCFTVDEGKWSGATGEWSTYVVKEISTLYLKPNANWLSKDARFAVYLSGGSNGTTWVSMKNAGNGYYSASIPAGYTNVIFARMNPANTTNSWANTWNKSATVVLPTTGSNCFTIADGQWSGATGEWSTYVVADTTTLYLKPNDNWTSKDARFAVYLSGGSNSTTWVSMTDAGKGYYMAEVPTDYTSVIFARMNPATTENSWANTWNKSATQTIPVNDNNCFTVDEGKWSGATGEWSTYVVVDTTTLYLKPNANWTSKDARFAIYLSGGSSSAAWISMTSAGNGYYMAEVPASYTSVIFARMNPANTTNSWANTWNKSATQTIPTNDNNCFTVDEGKWSGATGKWSEYSDPTEATAVIHFVDDNDREPVVANVGDTVEYDVYIKLTDSEVQAFSTWTYYNQPVGTKKTKNQEGIVDSAKIPSSCNVLSVKKDGYTPYYSPFDTSYDIFKQDNLLIAFGTGSMNSDLSYNMLKTDNGSFTQNGGCLVSTIKFTVINPGEVEVFTRLDDAIVDLDNGEIHSEYVAIYNEKVVEDTNTIYFKPNSNWTGNSARFAMYLSGGTSASVWVSMTDAGNGCYKAEMPQGDYKNIMFVRMNPANTTNSWSNMWNKSASLTVPTDGSNYFTMSDGQWSGATGVWSTK